MDEQEEQIEDEYEMQHFGGLTGSNYTMFLKSELLYAFKEMFEALRTELPNNESDGIIKDLNCDQANYEAAVNQTMESFKVSEKQFFSIPKNIVLPADLLYVQYENNIDELRATVEKYEKTYLKQKMYISGLDKQLEVLNKIQPLKDNINELLLLSANSKKTGQDVQLKMYIANIIAMSRHFDVDH